MCGDVDWFGWQSCIMNPSRKLSEISFLFVTVSHGLSKLNTEVIMRTAQPNKFSIACSHQSLLHLPSRSCCPTAQNQKKHFNQRQFRYHEDKHSFFPTSQWHSLLFLGWGQRKCALPRRHDGILWWHPPLAVGGAPSARCGNLLCRSGRWHYCHGLRPSRSQSNPGCHNWHSLCVGICCKDYGMDLHHAAGGTR